MGDRRGHIRKAQHNEKFLNQQLSLLRNFNDWKTIVIFYSAVHFVDAALSRFGIHPTRHEGSDGRNAYVSVHFRNVSGKYQTLYNRSRYARYEPDSELAILDSEVERLMKYLELFKSL